MIGDERMHLRYYAQFAGPRAVMRGYMIALGALIAYAAGAAAMASEPATSAPPAADAKTIEIVEAEEGRMMHIRVLARDGRLRWADVLAALSRAKGFDDTALERVLPEGSIELGSLASFLVIKGVDHALGDAVAMRVDRAPGPAGQPGDMALAMTIDRWALESKKRIVKGVVRNLVLDGLALTGTTTDTRYGMEFDAGWRKSPDEKGLVVLVHGYQSKPERHETLLKAVRELGIPTAWLRYPNDQALTDSTKLLAEGLAKIAAEFPRRPITLVTVSMGGLIARAVVEDKTFDPGTVKKIIMVAPPNHGSNLARLSAFSELWEIIVKSQEPDVRKRLAASFEDGLGEAPADLRPGSEFLVTLNRRPRNDKVRYAIILGSAGPLRQESLEKARAMILRRAEASLLAQFFARRFAALLADFDEMVEGKGDGAVSLKRGRLEGVKDTIVLGFQHWRLWDQKEVSTKLRNEIVKRVR